MLTVKKNLIFLLFVVCYGSSNVAFSDDQAIIVHSSSNEQKISSAASYYCTGNINARFQDIIHKTFEPWPGGPINFGRRLDTCWVSFTLVNEDSSHADYIVASRFAYIDHLDLYYYQGNKVVENLMGDQYPLHQRAFKSSKHLARVTLAPGEVKTFYLRIKSQNVLIAPVSIYPEDLFISTIFIDEWVSGLFYGLVCGLFLLALLLYYHFNDWAYVFYSAQMISVLILFFNIDGISSYLLPNAVEYIDYLHVFSAHFAAASALLFASAYLSFNESRFFSIVTKVLCGLIVFCVLLLPIIPLWVSIFITSITSSFLAAFLMVGSVYKLFQGMVEAKYYSFAWGVLLVGILWVSVSAAFGLKSDIPSSLEYIKYAYLLQQIILGIGLSSRIRTLQKKEQAARVDSATVSAAMGFKNELFAKMSHEIRTPMTGVLGLLDLLKDTQLNEKQEMYVDTASGSATTLLTIINDVLDFSKIEAGKMVLAVSSFDIKQTLAESVDTFAVQAKNKGLVCQLEISDDFPDFISGDAIRIRQILLNLLSNAVKFTELGCIKLEAKVEKALGNHEVMLSLAVVDTGIGMSRQLVEKMFKLYEQGERSSSHLYVGTGLGLNICAQLVELMHGEISVDSQLGKGSTFKVTFPASVKSDTMEERCGVSYEELPDLHGVKILAAEDNPVNQIVIKGMMDKLNILTVFADNGKQAFDRYSQLHEDFDLILMDCEMPEIDGLTATRMIREFEQQQNLNKIPIIALTAQTSKSSIEECFNVGMSEHLAKPIQLPLLAAVLERLLISGE